MRHGVLDFTPFLSNILVSKRPHRLVWPRTSGSQPEDWGSNPHGAIRPPSGGLSLFAPGLLRKPGSALYWRVYAGRGPGRQIGMVPIPFIIADPNQYATTGPLPVLSRLPV